MNKPISKRRKKIAYRRWLRDKGEFKKWMLEYMYEDVLTRNFLRMVGVHLIRDTDTPSRTPRNKVVT
jgi:hypothetical protein